MSDLINKNNLEKKGFDLSDLISPKGLDELSPELVDALGDFANESRNQLCRKSDAYFLSDEVLGSLTDGDYIM